MNNEIRFIEKDGEWWAVLKDVCDALGIKAKRVRERLTDEVVSKGLISDTMGRTQEMLIVNELGLYSAIFQSRKKEVKEFQQWTFQVLKEIRQAIGLQGFEIF